MDPVRGQVEIKNKYLFTDLADFELYWCQCSDKGVFRDGVVEVQLAPGEKKVLTWNWVAPATRNSI